MSGTNFLFWNVNRRPLSAEVSELVAEHRINVVVLAGCVDAASTLTALNLRSLRNFSLATSECEAITVFIDFSPRLMVPVYESKRISLRRLRLPRRQELLISMVHLPSKQRMKDKDQYFECMELARTITETEDRLGHRRTVLIGDLNMNPFEPGVVAASGFNAVMSRQIAGRGKRQVEGRSRLYFYNPMWQHFGDARDQTAGSYFYDKSQQVTYYWNVFDQVLIRPDLLAGFDPAKLRILKSVGDRLLVKANGRPDSSVFSDHLPLVFALQF